MNEVFIVILLLSRELSTENLVSLADYFQEELAYVEFLQFESGWQF